MITGTSIIRWINSLQCIRDDQYSVKSIFKMKPRTESEYTSTCSSPCNNNQPMVAPKTITTVVQKRNVLSYFGAMLTICIFGFSNYLWLATSWSPNIVRRQNSIIRVPLDNGNGNTRVLQLEQRINASTSTYTSQTMEKYKYDHQPLTTNNNNSNAIEVSPFSSTDNSVLSSFSCATANDEVLNMGNRTRLGTGEKILLVGLAKAGTTSVGGFFHRAGYKACDFRCGKKLSNLGTVARCMWQAQQDHKPLMASCGGHNIEMYAQMDTIGWPRKDFCFFPQIDALDDLHAEHPSATFILNMRQNADRWYDSVLRWHDLRQRLVNCTSGPANDTSVAFKDWYCQHIQRIRNFVAQHPTHALVEINVEDPSTATKLASLFGTDPQHWMPQNQNLITPGNKSTIVQEG